MGSEMCIRDRAFPTLKSLILNAAKGFMPDVYLEKVDVYCNNGLDSGYEGDLKTEVECVEAAKSCLCSLS